MISELSDKRRALAAADAPPAPDGFDPWTALRLIGYPLDDRAATVRAFRNHFRGQGGTELDAEDLRILHALTWQRSPVSQSPEAGAP